MQKVGSWEYSSALSRTQTRLKGLFIFLGIMFRLFISSIDCPLYSSLACKLTLIGWSLGLGTSDNKDDKKDSVCFSLSVLLRTYIRGQISYSKARTGLPEK